MKYLLVLALLVSCGKNDPIPPAPTPTPTPPPVVVTPDLKLPYKTTWSLQYDKYPFAHNGRQAYVGDLWGTPQSEIDRLRSIGALVYCYFSTQFEDWRDDADEFPRGDIGEDLDGWEGENFVNTRSPAIRAIMARRLDLAVSRGCDGVDPDNTDGYLFAKRGLTVERRGRRVNGIGTGPKTLRNTMEGLAAPMRFDMSIEAYADYYLFLAQEAHARGLRITLKNSMDLMPLIGDTPDSYQNEECGKYDECDTYDSVQGKRSIHMIEYSLFCPREPYPKAFITKRTNMARGETVCQTP